MQLLLNFDLDDADPNIQHGSAILLRSSWLRPFYRTNYDVQLPVIKSGMQLPHMLQQRLDAMHTSVKMTHGHQHTAGRACHQHKNSDGEVCESIAHTIAQRNISLQASPPASQQVLPQAPLAPPSAAHKPDHMDALIDDIIAARPLVGPYNASLLLYFRGSVYRYSPGYERRTQPLRELILSLGPAVNTLNPTSGHAIVIDGMCYGPWPDASTQNPELLEKLSMAPHCAGCKASSRLLADNSSQPCDAAPGLPTYKHGMAAARFTLTPLGVGAQTYRTLEAIAAGSVPVVLSDDMVAPYDGEGRLGQLWDACLVRTLSSEITGLPEMLLGMTEAQYRRHLSACLLVLGERELFVDSSIVHGLCAVASRLADQLKKGAEWLGPASRWCEVTSR